MKENSIVQFYRTGNRYIILSFDSMMKCIKTGDWYPSVIYREYSHFDKISGEYTIISSEDAKIYVREKSDFQVKFNLVEQC